MISYDSILLSASDLANLGLKLSDYLILVCETLPQALSLSGS